MPRRRLYAELEPAPEEEAAESSFAEPEPSTAAEHVARSPIDSPQGRVIALQRGAGNAATGRLLRKVAEEQRGAEPDDQQVQRERVILENTAVPAVLDRLYQPELKGVRESLPEVALFARGALAERMRESSTAGAGPVKLRSTATDVQKAVMKVARQRNIVVPGHRPFGDPVGLEIEAQALGDLIGKDMKDLGKVETSAEGITFAIEGELKALRPAIAGGALGGAGRDSGRIELKVDARPVELKGEILAKSGRPTKWSAKLEIKIADGTDALPDAGSIAKLVHDAGHDIVEAAHALDAAMASQRDVDKQAVEQALKPSKDSLEEVVGYMEQHTAEMEARPHPPPQPGAKDSDGGSVSAQITLAITF